MLLSLLLDPNNIILAQITKDSRFAPSNQTGPYILLYASQPHAPGVTSAKSKQVAHIINCKKVGS